MPRPTPPPTPTSRAGRLIDLVRRLIEYGKELAATLRQPDTATNLPTVLRSFGTADIALILAQITRGLHRANALEARLIRNAALFNAPPRPRAVSTPTQRTPTTQREPAPPRDPRLVRFPTPEQIAAEVRRRPIGAVFADLCRDLGILPSHPLWRELQQVIIRHGGSFAGLIADILQRRANPYPAPAGWTLSWAGAPLLPASAAGTGPPS